MIDRIKDYFIKLMRPKHPLTFVHTDTDLSRIDTKTDLILSPSFYWCKKENLAIKSTYKAKKLAQSIFFSSLPEGNFTYRVFKSDDDFYFFAYDANKIYASLLSQGLKEEFLSRIYFAQTLIKSDIPVKISKDFVLTFQDDIAFVAPISYAKQTTTLNSLSIVPSRNYVRIKKRLMPRISTQNKTLPFAAGLISIWIICTLIPIFSDLGTIGDYEKKTNALFATHKLPQTSFELNAILKKYEKISQKQDAIRSTIAKISNYYATSDNHFTHIWMKKNIIYAQFVCNKERMDILRKSLQETFKDAKITQTSESFNLEFKL